MCYKLLDEKICKYCTESAIVYRTCINEIGKAYNCTDSRMLDDYYVNKCDMLAVKYDNPTEITYICGSCIYNIISGGDDDDDTLYEDRIYKSKNHPEYVNEFMIHALLNTNTGAAEDSGLCGYKDKNENVIVTFSTYELSSTNITEETTVIFPKSDKCI